MQTANTTNTYVEGRDPLISERYDFHVCSSVDVGDWLAFGSQEFSYSASSGFDVSGKLLLLLSPSVGLFCDCVQHVLTTTATTTTTTTTTTATHHFR
jgi:hypothetical protein